MRGSPLLRALAALVILLALGLPMRRLLQPRSEAAPAVVSAPAPPRIAPSHLQLSFTRIPARFTVKSLGEIVWTSASPAAEQERDLLLTFPPEGIELVLEIAWADGEPAAARLHLTDPSGREYDRFLWSKGAITDVLAFP